MIPPPTHPAFAQTVAAIMATHPRLRPRLARSYLSRLRFKSAVGLRELLELSAWLEEQARKGGDAQ